VPDSPMTRLDSQLAHGRRLLVIMISPRDAADQYAISGIARWDGSSLWLDSDTSREPVLLTKPGSRLFLSDLTPETRLALRDDQRHVAVPAAWVNGSDCLAVAPLDRVPAGAVAVPGAISQAIVPEWKPGEPGSRTSA
jgi:hypothetical protein